ncbi:ATP-binding protein [Streptomyces sp. Je 1-4]|uniref:ATP-binding protein n=1 Tax=Streptomyces TaxID=1883 RepID=UPI0021DA11FB|nr:MULTISPECIES: ATP-binding protein [unclassified Streptomyces]UYB41709.1 ATP-binding protein [Streptomyces sp. Je 1-4]UZQ37968.1 ATP-binding protein [Streptomyces sp. Je 1-4] [Streptomyces sp. Je 1-4 4N24]UZQ45385.1 ATP-binding protein [Streptomyces sp. Je 1-4] [Streptomyces sp. Je 1-4 4N24_ara]
MTGAGVILYGPPGSGKDTITAELNRLRGEFTLFQRLKAGAGRTTGYRLTTLERINELDQAGELLYRNSRYNAEYAIDRGGLSELLKAGRTPVLHMGQVAGASAVQAFPLHWAKVLLWCPKEVTAERSAARGDKDVEARLAVWDETREDLLAHAEEPWSLVVETHRQSPTEAAELIAEALAANATAAVRDIRGLVS